MRLRCRAPATVANLGPGFDSLAMAIDLWNEVIIETEAPPAVEVRGEGAGELPEDGSNLIFRSMTYLSREVGKPLPSFRLSSENRIPLERGLGSSSGAVVVAYLSPDGWRAERLDPSDRVRPTLLLPLDERIPTTDARRVLPREVPLADAAFNAGRAALMV